MILTSFFSLVTEMSVSKEELTGFLLPKKQEDIDELQEWAETSSEFELIDDKLEINKRTAFKLAPILQNGLGYALAMSNILIRNENGGKPLIWKMW